MTGEAKHTDEVQGIMPMKSGQMANVKVISKLMFRLLPIQILVAAAGAVNSIVSSFFASNYVGIEAMSAVGLYSPISMLIVAVSTMLAGGSAILCPKYLGRNEQDKMQSVYTMNLLLAALFACVFTALLLALGLLNLTGIFTRDNAVRPLFNRYLIGQVIGVFPFIVGSQLPTYLFLENRKKRIIVASLIYIGAHVALNYLFVQVLCMQTYGLALAASLASWVFLGIQASAFLGGRSCYKFRLKSICWPEGRQIMGIGLDDALSNG